MDSAGKRSVVAGSRQPFESDAYEDLRAEPSLPARRKLEEVGSIEPSALPTDFIDEEILSSDEDGASSLPSKGTAGNERRRDHRHIVRDSSDVEDGNGGRGQTFTSTASSRMLHAAGLACRRPRERAAPIAEAYFATENGAHLSVKALVGSLEGAGGLGQLRRNIGLLSGKQRFRAQLDAPLERCDLRRTERQAATAAVHSDVSGWDASVQKNRAAERLNLPLDRQTKLAGTSTNGLCSFRAETPLERSMDVLLNEHGLHAKSTTAQVRLDNKSSPRRARGAGR